MKIFATADIHGDRIIMDKLLKVAPEVDMILVCGDIGQVKGASRGLLALSVLQKKDLSYMTKVFSKTGVACRYILGNDDWIEGRGPFYLKKKELIEGEEFIPFEWVNETPFTTNREANENKLRYELSKFKAGKNSIIAAHTPPYGFGDHLPKNKKSCGSWSVLEWIDEVQPKIWFCGHIHEDFSVSYIGKTLVFNCTTVYQENILQGWIVDTETLKYRCVQI